MSRIKIGLDCLDKNIWRDIKVEVIKLKEKLNKKIYVILFFVLSFLFVVPSIIYLIKNKTIYRFVWFRTYLFELPDTQMDKILNALLFFGIFSVLFLVYILILKNYKKIFKNKKQIFILIFIVSILFMVIIPYTSLDVYSYIANGWSASHYKENPYYVSIGQIADETGFSDKMFNKVATCWRYETVVYGPLWTMICTILTSFSFGNIDIALYIFKFVNLLVHLINCILIYKITKRKLFMLLYGLNPFILFEALANTHNDIFIILFILLAIYFAIRKRNLFISVAFLAMATAVKYLAILILPFIVLYYVKDKNIKDRIKCCILCGIEYIAIIALFYCVYLQDLQVLAGLFVQQGKYNRSIFFVLYYLLKDKNMEIVTTVQNITFIAFAIYYAYIVIRLLLQKNMKFNEIIRKYHVILMFFTFIVITNFNPWYIMWLFPTIFWLKSKNINTVINLSYASQIGNILGFALFSEDEWLGIPYFIIMIVLTVMLSANNRNQKIQIGEISNEKK